MFDFDKRPIARKTSCIAGAAPMMSAVTRGASSLLETGASSSERASARRTIATASSTSKGLGRYSKAPPW